jgi:NADH-quinone oxidoreductase subunit H
MPLPSFITAQFVVSAVVLLVVVHVILVACAYSIYLERKISAWIQDRVGPNRVGFSFGLPFMPRFHFWGLGQPLADGIKFLLKEDYAPHGADRALFTLAPCAILIPALIGFAVIPWGGGWVCPDISIDALGIFIPGGPVTVAGAPVNVGVIYLIAVASIGIYGVVLGGWASNNKYSFLGSLRSSAQMICYEIPMGLSLLCVLLVVGSLLPGEIIRHQLEHGWLVFALPLPAVIFFLCMLAEANRAPFDNAECEQELVGGYHTEYSSMRFALFFLAEYAHMITSSALFALLFLGGWDLLPFVHTMPAETASIWIVLLKFAVYFGKVMALVCFMMVVRWTLPRLRFDQVMQVAWQGVIPLSLVLIVAVAVMVFLGRTGTLPLLAMNAGVALLVLAVVPYLPASTVNRRVPLPGSRFNPPAVDAGPAPGAAARAAPAGDRAAPPVGAMAGAR